MKNGRAIERGHFPWPGRRYRADRSEPRNLEFGKSIDAPPCVSMAGTWGAGAVLRSPEWTARNFLEPRRDRRTARLSVHGAVGCNGVRIAPHGDRLKLQRAGSCPITQGPFADRRQLSVSRTRLSGGGGLPGGERPTHLHVIGGDFRAVKFSVARPQPGSFARYEITDRLECSGGRFHSSRMETINDAFYAVEYAEERSQ